MTTPLLSPTIELEMRIAIKNLLDGMNRHQALDFARQAVCRLLATGGVDAELAWLRQIITPDRVAALRDVPVRQPDDPGQFMLGEYDYEHGHDAGADDAFAWDSVDDHYG